MSTYGIKETKEALDVLIKLANATDKSLADDGKVTWMEYSFFISAAIAIPKAVSGAEMIPKELGDLQDSEREEIKDFIRENVDLANDATEETIERIANNAFDIFHLILDTVEAFRSLRTQEEE